ncbi:hypothetical protein F4810DRAFT_708681 [Camillea tinctor]|nr:hypothetical protein F4810DRAFT_708681 [Camillea tinctor]
MSAENDVISISSSESPDNHQNSSKSKAVDLWRNALFECLNKIEFIGKFGTAKQYSSFVNPGLEVDGSLIPLPLTPRDAEDIKRICKQAPFGKGSETVVDTSVRDTWELDPSRFRISNPKWGKFLSEIGAQVSKDLGMTNISLEPYKLLLYETGSFFKRHKDSEKAPRMIGTLVISLPSKHEGADVHLSHHGQTRIFGTAQSSAFDLSALAWYSDVTHEVSKLTAGYRLILTYNIILAAGVGDAPSPDLFLKQQDQIHQLLTQWRKKHSHIKQELFLLEHKYTKASLSLNNLKGRDRAVCQTLHSVCLDSGFIFLFAKITRSLTMADDYYDHDEDDDYITIDSVLDCNGVEIASSHDLELEDILGPDLYEGRDPDSEEEGEFTGNESMPETHRYHDTAAMIIPLSGLYKFLNGRDNKSNEVLVNMAARELEKNRNNQNVEAFAVNLMVKALKYPLTGSAQATIAKWGFTLQKDVLYEEAIKSAFKRSSFDELVVVISHAILDAYAKDPSQFPDWDVWMSGFITGYTNLSLLASVLGQIQGLLGNESLQGSFREWRLATLQKSLAAQEVLDVKDYDFIVLAACASMNDLDQMSTRIIAKLATSGTRDLIYRLIEYFLRDSRGKALKNAEAGAKLMLESLYLSLRLEIKDLAPSYHLTGYGRPPSHIGEYCGKFTSLLDDILKLKWNDCANKLLDSSCSHILDQIRDPAISCAYLQRMGIEQFLVSLVSVLQQHRVEHLPSVRSLFETLLRNHVIADIPKYPRKLNGRAHRKRGCGSSTCGDCIVLDQFLTSSELRETSFKIGEKRRRHLEALLPSSVFQTRLDPKTRPATFIITKLGAEFTKDLNDYKRQVQAIERSLHPLRNEYTKQLLGDGPYNELILLESTPGSQFATQGGSQAKKRKAEEPPELPNALKRQK